MTPTDALENYQDSSFKVDTSHQLKQSMDDTENIASDLSSGYLSMSDNEDEVLEEDVEESVKEDMRNLEKTFVGVSDQFRLINRIGEGTFSTVYKAEDLLYHHYHNDWDHDSRNGEYGRETGHPQKRRRLSSHNQSSLSGDSRKRPRYVALKKIYATSSPLRIQNELELLNDLRGCKFVCPLITAFRCLDQVLAVLPYFPHTDFRLLYRTFLVADMRHYFRSLFTALHAVHKHNILHRDIKPTNFLYNPKRREGVLVDFGLAEREGSDYAPPCICVQPPLLRRTRVYGNYYLNSTQSAGYPKNDSRPSRRANRAGTRGFRAPEVLFKCTSQTTKIDIWSAGVILLTLLGRRFPFFNSADDVDAMIEIASVFGIRRMKATATMHGQVFETNLPSIGQKGYGWEKLIVWSSCVSSLTESEKQGLRLLSGLLELDPFKRLSAKEALQHEFFTNPIDHDLAWNGPTESQEEDGESAADEEPPDEGGDEMAML